MPVPATIDITPVLVIVSTPAFSDNDIPSPAAIETTPVLDIVLTPSFSTTDIPAPAKISPPLPDPDPGSAIEIVLPMAR